MTILKGNQRAGAIDLTCHLLNTFCNDSVELYQVRGSISTKLLGFLREIEAIAAGTNCTQPFYSLSINPSAPLTRKQFEFAADLVEAKLGLAGQPRAIVFHIKNGREHAHVVWSRIKIPAMKAVQLSHDRFKLKDIARKLGIQFDIPLPDGLTGKPRTGTDNTLAENAHTNLTGITPEERRFQITEAYLASDDAASFQNALAELGYWLAQGDQRCFVVVDRCGYPHSLTRQIEGVRTKHIKDKLYPLKPGDLPSFKELAAGLPQQSSPGPESEADREPSKFRQNQAKRWSSFYRDVRALEKTHETDLLALAASQSAERNTPLWRSFFAVYRILRPYRAFRAAFSYVHRLMLGKMLTRHRAELDSLRRRHAREWLALQSRENQIYRHAQRERRSAAKARLRQYRARQRYLDEISTAFTINALDITRPAWDMPEIITDAQSYDDQIDYEQAAITWRQSANYVPLARAFTRVADPDGFISDGDGDAGSPPGNEPPAPHITFGFNKNSDKNSS